MSTVQQPSRHPQAQMNQSAALFDDFFNYTSGNSLTTDTVNSGTCVATAPHNLVITTGSTSGNYQGVHSTLSSFEFTDGQGMYCEALVNWTDNSSDSCNIAFGFASTRIAPNGSFPSTSFSGAQIQRLSGTNVWSAQSSNGSTKTNSTSTAAANGGGSYLLGVAVRNFDANNASIVYYVNGHALRDTSTNLIIQHKVAYASIAASNLYLTIVASTNNAEVLNCDYITASIARVITFNED